MLNKMKYIVGAYATAPSLSVDDMVLEREYYQQLIESMPNILGLEIPFWGDDIHRFGAEFLLNYIRPQWNNVLTCIPGTTRALQKNVRFGLSSDDEAGRREAVELHKRANLMVHRVNEVQNRSSIIAVHLATAPTVPVDGVSSSSESLLKSMQEILSWDWMGARVVIEHCDSSIENRSYQKGFMAIENEIAVLNSLKSDYNVGLSINWARSAIEGRSASTVLDHLGLAQKNGLLSGMMFSGTSIHDEAYGSWTDMHMPFAQSYNIEYYEPNSLLTEDNIKNTLGIIDLQGIDYLGIKLLSMPMDLSPVKRRVGVNRDAIIVLDKALQELSVSEVKPATRSYA